MEESADGVELTYPAIERRSHWRFGTAYRVEFTADGKEIISFVSQMSQSGMLLRSAPELQAGDECTFTVHLPDNDKPLQVEGRALERHANNKAVPIAFLPGQTHVAKHILNFTLSHVIPSLESSVATREITSQIIDLAQLHADTGNLDAAAQVYRDALGRHPREMRIREHLVRLLMPAVQQSGDNRESVYEELRELTHTGLSQSKNATLLAAHSTLEALREDMEAEHQEHLQRAEEERIAEQVETRIKAETARHARDFDARMQELDARHTGLDALAATHAEREATNQAIAAQLEQQSNTLATQMSDLHAQQERLRVTAAEVQAREERAAAEMAAVQAQKLTYESRLADMQKEQQALMASMQAEHEQAAAATAELHASLKAQSEQLAQENAQLQAQRVAFSDEISQIDTLRRDFSERTTALENERESVDQQRQLFGQQHLALQEQRQALQEREAAVDQFAQMHAAKQQEVAQQVADIESARLRLARESDVLAEGVRRLDAMHAAEAKQRQLDAEQLETKSAELMETKRSIDDLIQKQGSRRVELEIAHQSLADKAAALARQDQILATSRQALTAQQDKNNEQAARLNVLQAEWDARVKGHEERALELTQQVAFARAEEEAQHQRSAALSALESRLEDQTADLRNRQLDLAAREAAYTDKVGSVDVKFQELEQSRAALEDSRAALEQNRVTLEQSHAALEQSRAALEGKTAEISGLQASLDAKHQELTERENALQAQVTAVIEREAAAQALAEESRQEQERATQSTQEFNSEAASAHLAELEQLRETHGKFIDTLRQQHAQRDKELDELRGERDTLEVERSVWRQRLHDMEEEQGNQLIILRDAQIIVEDARDKSDAAQAEMARAKAEADATIATLRAELTALQQTGSANAPFFAEAPPVNEMRGASGATQQASEPATLAAHIAAPSAFEQGLLQESQPALTQEDEASSGEAIDATAADLVPETELFPHEDFEAIQPVTPAAQPAAAEHVPQRLAADADAPAEPNHVPVEPDQLVTGEFEAVQLTPAEVEPLAAEAPSDSAAWEEATRTDVPEASPMMAEASVGEAALDSTAPAPEGLAEAPDSHALALEALADASDSQVPAPTEPAVVMAEAAAPTQPELLAEPDMLPAVTQPDAVPETAALEAVAMRAAIAAEPAAPQSAGASMALSETYAEAVAPENTVAPIEADVFESAAVADEVVRQEAAADANADTVTAPQAEMASESTQAMQQQEPDARSSEEAPAAEGAVVERVEGDGAIAAARATDSVLADGAMPPPLAHEPDPSAAWSEAVTQVSEGPSEALQTVDAEVQPATPEAAAQPPEMLAEMTAPAPSVAGPEAIQATPVDDAADMPQVVTEYAAGNEADAADLAEVEEATASLREVEESTPQTPAEAFERHPAHTEELYVGSDSELDAEQERPYKPYNQNRRRVMYAGIGAACFVAVFVAASTLARMWMAKPEAAPLRHESAAHRPAPTPMTTTTITPPARPVLKAPPPPAAVSTPAPAQPAAHPVQTAPVVPAKPVVRAPEPAVAPTSNARLTRPKPATVKVAHAKPAPPPAHPKAKAKKKAAAQDDAFESIFSN